MEAQATLPTPAALLCRRAMLQIALYFGLLTSFSGVGGGLVQIPVALFQALTGIPAIHTRSQALLVGAMVGALCAAAFASFSDLYTRCCPRGLEGAAILVIATRDGEALPTSGAEAAKGTLPQPAAAF